MANYNKSFNFRNGVQVDDDNFLVNSNGLVGIGTTIPRAELDVYGTLRATGIITAKDVYVTGVATFSNIRIGAGITIDGNAGIITAKFYGDGAGLYNIPTSQWVDVDPAVYPGVGVGYSSIYTAGTVGIGTTTARSFLQVGGDPILGQSGVGINSLGSINATGIVTAGSFVGSGASLTALDASNISSGTLNNSRLPSNINVSGVVTATTFSGQVNAGVGTISTLTGTTGTVTNLTSTNLSGTIGTITTLSGTIGTITNLTSTNLSGTIGTITTLSSTNATATNLSGTIGTITTLSGTNLNYTGFGTVANLTSTNATVTNLSGTIGTVTTLSGTNLNYSGVGTVGVLTATQATIGVFTATSSKSGSIQLGVTAANQVDTTSGNLVLDSTGGLVDINDNIDVLGTSVLQDEVTVNTGIIPDTSTGAYLGKTGKQFSEAWIGDIKISVGVGNSNKIETISQDLVLDSVANKVTVDANLSVAGVSTFTGNLTLGSGIEPASDLGTTLGSASKRFSSSQIGGIRVGVAQTFEIDTISGTDLVLNSSSGTTKINDNLLVSGIGTFTGEITAEIGIIPDNDKGAYLGTSGKSFSEAFIDEVRIGVGATNKIDTRVGPLLLDGANNLVNVENRFLVSGISTLSGNLTVGSNNEFFVNTSTGKVGIGTNVLNNKFQVKDTSNLTAEFRTDNSVARIGLGISAIGAGKSVGNIAYSTNALIFTNEDAGGMEFKIHSGTTEAGISTESFKWIYGQTNGILMSLTHDRKLGIGLTDPSNTIHVSGTSTVTGDALFGANVSIAGILTAGTLSLPPIITSNIGTTTGISTFRAIGITSSLLIGDSVGSNASVGIGTTRAIVGFDAKNSLALFDGVGVGVTVGLITSNTIAFGGQILGGAGTKIGIGTTSVGAFTANIYGPVNIDRAIGSTGNSLTIYGTQVQIDINSGLLVGDYNPPRARAVIDFGSVGTGLTSHQYMLPPIISTATRNGIGGTVAGAIIYNSNTNKHQGFNGTTWNDLY